jgi:hypothetical protein
MERKFMVVMVLTTILAISTSAVVVFAKGKPDKPPDKPSTPDVAIFSITFTGGDIASSSFETEASTENWEPQVVKGRKNRVWATDHYAIAGFFSLNDVPLDEAVPDPLFGLMEYTGGSVCEFFDTTEPITISWLDHFYTKDNDAWNVALNQTDEEGHNNVLVMDNWVSGTESYDETEDQWTVTFEDSYCHIQWWEDGVFHNVWKGRLSFIVTVQRLPEIDF